MKFDPPILTEGPSSGKVYVVTHGRVDPHPTIEGETMVIASVKYDVTEQFDALAAKRTDKRWVMNADPVANVCAILDEFDALDYRRKRAVNVEELVASLRVALRSEAKRDGGQG